MSTLDQSIACQRPHLLTGQIQTMDPAEDNQVFDLLYEYETVQLNQIYLVVMFNLQALSGQHCIGKYGARSPNLGVLRGDRLAFCLPIMKTESRWWGRSISTE